MYQVETVFDDYKQEYMEILSDNIQDYYIQVSENKEAIINNKVAQKALDNITIISVYKDGKKYNDYQLTLDEFQDYQYATDDKIIKEAIRKKLRFYNNVQTSLNRYLPQRVNLGGQLQPTNLRYSELINFEVDEAIIEYMSNNVFIASESTLSRVTQKVYDIIKEEYGEKGEGARSVAEKIQERFTELKDFEAERIARTETLKAQGHATYNRLLNNPNVEYIQWISTVDDRTRDSHLELDGEITFADGTGVFSNGLKFPGDTSGDPEEWMNCRCDIIAYIPDVGFVPPEGATSWFEDEMLFDTSLEIPEVYVEFEEYLASYW